MKKSVLSAHRGKGTATLWEASEEELKLFNVAFLYKKNEKWRGDIYLNHVF